MTDATATSLFPIYIKKGLRYFVVSDDGLQQIFPDAIFLRVSDTLAALQEIAAAHRANFGIPVIGITGSNGKTIVKEWLYHCLHTDHRVVRSPRSYNSQIGVPLSIWQMADNHELAIFEAGISKPGEMQKLEKMIRPNIGVLTNIGDAHNEGFADKNEKLQEKLNLFSSSDIIIGRYDDLKEWKQQQVNEGSTKTIITWSKNGQGDWNIKNIEKGKHASRILLCPGAAEFSFEIPFTDDASIENAVTCFIVLHQLGLSPATIIERLSNLQSVDMRLQLIRGINHCTIINDSYSADLNSLAVALQFMQQQAGAGKKTLILSDFYQSARNADELYPEIYRMASQFGVSRMIGIGNDISHSLKGHMGKKKRPKFYYSIIHPIFFSNSNQPGLEMKPFSSRAHVSLVLKK
ncbi:MAG: Mur ligase family protein [Chitinophagaceae bacterium]|nr:Mur ligase family protein [Chitinophagaceae bacterium]